MDLSFATHKTLRLEEIWIMSILTLFLSNFADFDAENWLFLTFFGSILTEFGLFRAGFPHQIQKN